MNYYNELIQNTHTTQDISLLSKEIETLQQTLYQTNESFQQTLHTQIRASTAKLIQTLLSEIEPANHTPQPNQTAKALQDILSFTKSLPIIHLTLALEPSIYFIIEISTFIRKEILQNAIIEITINPEILGGLTLDYNGKYHDYSLKKWLDNYIAK